jgi:hypothetical protein
MEYVDLPFSTSTSGSAAYEMAARAQASGIDLTTNLLS